jgi:formate-dependent phosphoribosylglycinamide formyltransferase (GAR transformylase)
LARIQPCALGGGVFGEELFVPDDEFAFDAVCFRHAPHAESSNVISASAIDALDLLFATYCSPFDFSFSTP